MTATDPPADVAQTDALAAPAEGGASLTDVAQHTAEYARAWGSLLINEAVLAKANLVRLLILALIVPALALGILLSIDALLAALLHRWLQDWSLAVCGVLSLNMVALLATLMLLRSWWRSLSLPRSRAALSRFIKAVQ